MLSREKFSLSNPFSSGRYQTSNSSRYPQQLQPSQTAAPVGNYAAAQGQHQHRAKHHWYDVGPSRTPFAKGAFPSCLTRSCVACALQTLSTAYSTGTVAEPVCCPLAVYRSALLLYLLSQPDTHIIAQVLRASKTTVSRSEAAPTQRQATETGTTTLTGSPGPHIHTTRGQRLRDLPLATPHIATSSAV